VDVSHSMKFIASTGNERMHPITVSVPAGVKSGDIFTAEAVDENGSMRAYTLNCPEGANGPCQLKYNMMLDKVSSKLETCQNSIKGIIRNNCEAADRIALITFADDVRVDFKLDVKGPNESQLVSLVDSMETRGETAFYSAVKDAARMLANDEDDPDHAMRSKWIVALTDGADNKSDASDYNSAIQILQSTPKLNFALITIGEEGDQKKFAGLKRAAERDGIGMIVPASNTKAIEDAFAKIAATMAATAGGASG